MRSAWLLPLLALLACQSPPEVRHRVQPSFYHWQSALALTELETARMDSLGVEAVYLRYFDLDWSESYQQVVPVAVLTVAEPWDPKRAVIPTVFITNRSLTRPDLALDTLAHRMAAKIERISRELGQPPIQQLQIDCDWTERSREAYFQLLEHLRTHFPQVLFSATIRLHQIKYPERTGVPPVDRGMLMFYNVDDVADPTTQNSILDWPVAEAYLGRLPDYPLDLDLALPIFAWGAVFREGRLLRLLNNLRRSDLRDSTRFRSGEMAWVELSISTYLQGHYLYRGDRIRLEAVTREDLLGVVRQLRPLLRNNDLHLAFYHLDT
ncbi:MAG: hypothetical protein AAFR05_22005, partial [Bacteroidota bacterium]